MEPSPQIHNQLREQRQGFLVRACAFASVVAGAALVLELTDPDTTVSTLLARSLNVGGLGGMAVLLRSERVRQHTAEVGVLFLVAFAGLLDMVARIPALSDGAPFGTWVNAWLAYVVLLLIASHIVLSPSGRSLRSRNLVGLTAAYGVFVVAAMRSSVDSGDVAAAVALPAIAAVMLDAMHRMYAFLAKHEARAAAEAWAGRVDPLTDVLNRRGVLPRLTELQPGDGVMLLDVDHFKAVNDEHGHDVGDHVLRQIAAVLGGAVRDEDVVARWGGEEFLVVTAASTEDADGARDGTDEESAEAAIAERIRASVAAGPTMVPTTVSVGVAVMTEADGDWQDVVRRADLRLYEAKRAGRDRVVLADEIELDPSG